MLSRVKLALGIGALALAVQTLAAETTKSTTNSSSTTTASPTTANAPKVAPVRPLSPQARMGNLMTFPLEESEGSFQLTRHFRTNVGYTLSTDLNQTVRPRSYGHIVSLDFSRTFLEDYNASIGSTISYTTLNSDVVRSNANDPYYTWDDISLGVSRAFRFRETQSVNVSIAESLMVSEFSRYAGYRNVISGSATYSPSVTSWLAIGNAINAGHIWNRYRFSRIETQTRPLGGINPDYFYGYSVGPTFRLLKGLSLSARVSMRGTHYLDQTNTYSFGNSYSIAYSKSNWLASLSYINRGYADRGDTNLWFLDEYRSLASLNLGVNF